MDVAGEVWGPFDCSNNKRKKFPQVTVTKMTDRSTPLILNAAIKGTHIAEGTLTVRKSGAKALDYLVFKFQDIEILSGGDLFSFSAAHTTVEYTPQKSDGTGGGKVTAEWDIGGN